jgi:hypothetical protein
MSPKSTVSKPSRSKTSNRISRTRIHVRAPDTPPTLLGDDNLPTLDELTNELGESSEEEVLAILRHAHKNDLVADGASVATSRITTDTRRIYGHAARFLATATPAQRGHLVSVTPRVLRAAVWAAHHGDRLAQAFDTSSERTAKSKTRRTASAGDVRNHALLRRAQLIEVANALYGDDSADVAIAVGTVDTPANLDTSIKSLTTLVRAALTDRSPEMAAAREGVTVTVAWLDESLEIAAEARTAGEHAATARATPTITHGTLDYWDGINLRFLRRVLRAFEIGHRADPTIPVLVPISLRNILGRAKRTTRKPAEEKPAAAAKG